MSRDPAPTIDELKKLQRQLNLLDVHLCWVGPEGFALVHTNEERARASDLENCELHRWLRNLPGPPAVVGYYIVTAHEPDAYSESYPLAQFDFTHLEG